MLYYFDGWVICGSSILMLGVSEVIVFRLVGYLGG